MDLFFLFCLFACCSIYNVTFILAFVIPILGVGLGGRRTVYLVRDFAVMFVSMSTLALLYVPKMMMLMAGGKAGAGAAGATDGNNTTSPVGNARGGRVVHNITVVKSEGSDRSQPTPGAAGAVQLTGAGGAATPVGRTALLSPSAAAAAATEPFNFNQAGARASPVPSSRIAAGTQAARVLSSAVSLSGGPDADADADPDADLLQANLVSGLGEEPASASLSGRPPPPPQLPGAVHEDKAAHYRVNQ